MQEMYLKTEKKNEEKKEIEVMETIQKRLPVILVEADTCGEAWERAVKEVWEHGIDIEQHYSDKLSKEATVIINVRNPLKEPRFSDKDFISVTMFKTGKSAKLYKERNYRAMEYVTDIIDGTMNERVKEGIESYTYNERLFSWGLRQPKHEELLDKLGKPHIRFIDKMGCFVDNVKTGINQVELLIQKVGEEPISRKLQITTWQPHKDLLISGAPCLQRIWIRIIDSKFMVMETMWRSRDLYKAWGSNVVGMTEFGKWIAERAGLELIQYVDCSNSLHIYASDYDQIERHFEIIGKREKTFTDLANETKQKMKC